MQTKAPFPELSHFRHPQFPVLELYAEFHALKHLYRRGWLLRRVPEGVCESVAEHSFGVALLALLLAEQLYPELDCARIMRLALLHDLGEVYTGDLTPVDSGYATHKSTLEKQAIATLFDKWPNGERYKQTWYEYEAGITPEAQFVRQIDRLEMALQAGVYEDQLPELDLTEFFDSAAAAVSWDSLQEILAAAHSLRHWSDQS